MNDSVLTDGRVIEGLYIYPFGEEGEYLQCVKDSKYKNCECIEVYEDCGPGSMVPWIRVFKDGVVWRRVMACYCEITYETPTPKAPASGGSE